MPRDSSPQQPWILAHVKLRVQGLKNYPYYVLFAKHSHSIRHRKYTSKWLWVIIEALLQYFHVCEVHSLEGPKGRIVLSLSGSWWPYQCRKRAGVILMRMSQRMRKSYQKWLEDRETLDQTCHFHRCCSKATSCKRALYRNEGHSCGAYVSDCRSKAFRTSVHPTRFSLLMQCCVAAFLCTLAST